MNPQLCFTALRVCVAVRLKWLTSQEELCSYQSILPLSGCTPFQSMSTDINCTGTINTSLTIPCGLLLSNDSSSNFSYQLYPLIEVPSTQRVLGFLTLRLQLTHHRMRVICFNDVNQKQAVYKLNVTCK